MSKEDVFKYLVSNLRVRLWCINMSVFLKVNFVTYYFQKFKKVTWNNTYICGDQNIL